MVQQPFEFGYKSMELMAKILNGDRSQIPASKQIFVPTKAVKKDNVEQFTKEINALRGQLSVSISAFSALKVML